MRRVLFVVILAIAVIVVIALLRPAPTNTPTNTTTNTDSISLQGVSLSPRSTDGEDFTNFFSLAKQAGPALTWVGDIADLAQTDGAPEVILQQSAAQGLTPIMIASVPIERLASDTAQQTATQQAVDFVQKNQPKYFGLGNEINFQYKDDSNALMAFTKFFATTATAIKHASPKTQVFTVWQLEWLKGLHGGLYGGQNNPTDLAQWYLLDQFPDADFFAFTSYPMLIFQDPSDIPTNYYADIANQTAKPIAFSEIGWFRSGPSGWSSSSKEQAQFINQFFASTEALHPLFRIWPFVYDQPAPEPFTTTGLLSADQTTSPAWEAWLAQAN